MLHVLATIAAVGYFVIVFQGCSVGMAMSGKEEPNLGAFRVGSPRGEVELQLGSPISSVTTPEGGRTDMYEYELGNKPSAGRAAGHAALDILTLGLWEIVGTPIEAFQGDTHRLAITYSAQERVVAINQAVVPASSSSGAPEQQPPPAEPVAREVVATDPQPIHTTQNNKNLLRLRVGMSRDEVHEVMGDPESSEGHAWGTVWSYRTGRSSSGPQGAVASEYTPVILDDKGSLIGWGKNFLAGYRQL